MTSAELPRLDADTRVLIAPLEARGVSVTAAVWDDPGVDWTGFDLAVNERFAAVIAERAASPAG